MLEAFRNCFRPAKNLLSCEYIFVNVPLNFVNKFNNIKVQFMNFIPSNWKSPNSMFLKKQLRNSILFISEDNSKDSKYMLVNTIFCPVGIILQLYIPITS